MRTEYNRDLLAKAAKAGHQAAIFRNLRLEHGIAFDAGRAEDEPSPLLRFVAMDGRTPLALDGDVLAMDAPPVYAQSSLVTLANAGVPWYLANWIDPKVIPILVSPMMAAKIAGEVSKGDWTYESFQFMTVEAVGNTSVYGDYSQSGSTNANVNFPTRQNILFQAFLQYGQREVAKYGLAKLDWVSKQQEANALGLMKALNYLYFYGAAGLENYGLLNDPNLPAPLAPTFSWLTNSSATANTIYQDIVRMFVQLQSQSNGVVQMDDPMVLAMSPEQSVALKFITQYNTNSVLALLKENFPNLRIETAVQYGPPYNTGGQLVQLFVEQIEGAPTVECAFSSKLMAHNMVTDTSSWRQKRSSGGYGTVWYRPFLQVAMLG